MGKDKKEKRASSIPKDSLPDGWVEKYSEKKGKVYYKNSDTGETSWTFPAAADTEATSAPEQKKRPKSTKGDVEPPISKEEKKSKKDVESSASGRDSML